MCILELNKNQFASAIPALALASLVIFTDY